MSLDLSQNCLKNYTSFQIIGRGAYGEVYKAKQKKGGHVAIKKVLMDIQIQGIPSSSIRQISLLSEIDHENIVKLKDVLIQKCLYLVFEYIDQDLHQFILSSQIISPEMVKKIMYQILLGIQHCHRHRIIHRDIKPANILIDKDDNVKIGDFGLARTYSLTIKPFTPDMVTLYYRAPQILLGSDEYSASSDIWSVGCIFAELIIRKVLFKGDGVIDQLYRIFRTFGTPNESNWPGVSKFKQYSTSFPNYTERVELQTIVGNQLESSGLELIKHMLTYDPKSRITAKSALKHKYFQKMC